MRPQLPEHAIAALLRQCFVTPPCQSSRTCRQSVTRSSRSLYTTQRPRHTRLERQHRSYQNRSGEAVPSKVHFSAISPLEQTGNSQTRVSKTNIAVLGGGITGLSSAHYLARELPDASITIYETSDRLGGWVNSRTVDVDNGHVIFEQGPRTLRPHSVAGLVTLDMVCLVHF
jgi:oxygen-dependent protoporphyrinogen oxidase